MEILMDNILCGTLFVFTVYLSMKQYSLLLYSIPLKKCIPKYTSPMEPKRTLFWPPKGKWRHMELLQGYMSNIRKLALHDLPKYLLSPNC